MCPLVVKPDGVVDEVQNLRWLLDHWREVVWFDVIRRNDRSRGPRECWLIAHMENDTIYSTGFASSDVLLGWLNRPKFQGLPVKWFGAMTVAGGLKYYYGGMDYERYE